MPRAARPAQLVRRRHGLGAPSGGVGGEDGVHLGNGGHVSDVARLDIPVLDRLDQPECHVAVRPVDGNVHAALVGLTASLNPDNEPLAKEVDHRLQPILGGDFAKELEDEEVLGTQRRGAMPRPLVEEIRPLDERDQIVTRRDHVHRGAERRGLAIRRRAPWFPERTEQRVKLNQQSGLDAETLGHHGEPGARPNDDEGEHRRGNQPVSPHRSQHEPGAVLHLPVVNQIGALLFELGHRFSPLGRRVLALDGEPGPGPLTADASRGI